MHCAVGAPMRSMCMAQKSGLCSQSCHAQCMYAAQTEGSQLQSFTA